MEKFIQRIAKKAGDEVMKRFGKDGVRFTKSSHPISAVTNADLLSDRIIISAIKKRYPKHGIVSEESGIWNQHAEYTWIVDPIDGTLNFANSIPYFAVLIALARGEEIVLAAVYLPALKELFFAKAGKGAYLNGVRIRSTRKRQWKHSAGSIPSILNKRAAAFFKGLLEQAPGNEFLISNFGGAGEPYVAIGRRDWSVSIGAHVWDYAPGFLIAKEAGCVATNLKGRPWRMKDRELLVAANPVLHKQLLKLTKNV